MPDAVSPVPSVDSIRKSSNTARKTPYGWIHLDAHRWALGHLGNTDLKPVTRIVLLTLASHVTDTNCVVWMSQDALAELAGVSRRGFQLAIDDLVAAGEVEIEPETVGGMRRANRYTLPRCAAHCATRCAEITQRRAETDPDAAQNLRRKEVQVQDRTSTAPARQQPLISDPTALTFPVDGPGGPEWPLGQSLVAELTELFPTLDVLGECRRALAWVKANPAGRKTSSGMRRFLTGWLTRSNDRPRATQAHHGHRAPTGAQALQRRIEDSGTVDLGGLVDWYENDGSRK